MEDQVMWQDPIITGTRRMREEYARQFGHNADAIFQDILRRQTASGRALVSFQTRKPVSMSVALRCGQTGDEARFVGGWRVGVA